MEASPRLDTRSSHFFTVDVEEYFHVNAFESVISRGDWMRCPRRLPHILPQLLELLDRHGATGTFFVLGWVAAHEPAVVRQIADAGHEIASHGFWHRRVPQLSADEFRSDVRASKAVLEDIVGVPVLGYRAPSFSILPGYEWAFNILVEEGFRYDSSVFPIKRPGYGNPAAARRPYRIRQAAGALAEFPLATARLLGLSLPAAGGAYLRHLPFELIRLAFAQAAAAGVPGTFYIHPWELDLDHPRVAVSALTKWRHYHGIARTAPRLHRLLEEFRFVSIASALDARSETLAHTVR